MLLIPTTFGLRFSIATEEAARIAAHDYRVSMHNDYDGASSKNGGNNRAGLRRKAAANLQHARAEISPLFKYMYN
jgi:hypothetical protein